jgi:competence protein ComEC
MGRENMKVKIIILVSMVIVLGMFWWSLRNQEAKLVVCDVGQGDAILFTKKSQQVLVDTGPDNKKVLSCLERYLPFWDKKIEVLILSHSDQDHVGGLRDVLKSYKIENVFNNDELKPLIEQNIYSKKLKQNDIIEYGLIKFEVVNPENLDNFINENNDQSIAGILSYKDIDIFLTGDISSEVEQRLVWKEIIKNPVEILKVSHHGSETASSQELMDTIKPKYGLISVGKGNKFGHPGEEVIKRLKNNNVNIRRTDEEGDLVFKLDN